MNPAIDNQHESYAKFFENPSRETFRDLIKTDGGEADDVDFKRDWPDFAPLAKTALAMANSGGGVVIFGVEELEDRTKNPRGISKFKDQADVANGIRKFFPACLKYKTTDFNFKDSEYGDLKGKKFQVLLVRSNREDLPYVSCAAGEKIRQSAIYIRNKTASVEASHDELQKLIEQRIESGYSSGRIKSLRQHLSELQELCRFQAEVDSTSRGLANNGAHVLSMIVGNLINQKQSTLGRLLK